MSMPAAMYEPHHVSLNENPMDRRAFVARRSIGARCYRASRTIWSKSPSVDSPSARWAM